MPILRRLALTARFGDPRRTDPLTAWGTPRGLPVDRVYIDRFLDEHRASIRGVVLEVKSDQYASRFGASHVEVVDVDPANPRATVVGDLCDPGVVPVGRYQAAVVTQTLQFVRDPAAAVRNLLAALVPGGTLLLTVPCISRLDGDGDRWRWTPAGLSELLAGASPKGAKVAVRGFGNTLTARAFLFGLAAQDVPRSALDFTDPACPVLAAGVVGVPG